MSIRVRIAPSPTGNLHVGTARTALFNYLFAKHTGGKFILRIEDTDLDRSEAQYVQDIYEGLHLLGLQWDEGPDVGGEYGPYVQSERLEIYPKYAEQLVAEGKAYPCYCTPDELEAEKAQAMTEKRPYIYSRRCLNAETVAELSQDPSRKPALRFKIPDSPETIVLEDIVRGTVQFESALIGDFVIMKSNGIPSYNFAVVVDDITMQITHVIRGEDHVSNAPKQILLYEALKAPAPQFAHVGMILAADRSKLSKRHGATAVSEFIRQGYLPEAFTNFLSLLGWSPTDGQEIGTLDHFATLFTLERIVSSPAVFDPEKLNWLNGQMIRSLPLPELWEKALPFVCELPLDQYHQDKLYLMLDAVREPIVTLKDLPDAMGYFFGLSVSYDDPTCREVLSQAETRDVLNQFQSDFLPSAPFEDLELLAESLKTFAKGLQPLKMKTIMWAIRAATTGRVHGADLGKTLYLLGRQRIQSRVEAALGLVEA